MKVLLSSPNKKFVLSRSFLNFLRIFCKVKEQFYSTLEKFLPHPREFNHYFWPRGRRIRQKKLPGWPGFARSKKFFRGLPGGCIPLELTETLYRDQSLNNSLFDMGFFEPSAMKDPIITLLLLLQ